MTKERAQYLLKNLVYGDFKYAFRRPCDHTTKPLHSDGITEEEDNEIRRLWETMPGYTCYYSAVQRFALGKGQIPDFTSEQRAKMGLI